MGKSRENHGTILENHGKIMGKSWETLGYYGIYVLDNNGKAEYDWDIISENDGWYVGCERDHGISMEMVEWYWDCDLKFKDVLEIMWDPPPAENTYQKWAWIIGPTGDDFGIAVKLGECHIHDAISQVPSDDTYTFKLSSRTGCLSKSLSHPIWLRSLITMIYKYGTEMGIQWYPKTF